MLTARATSHSHTSGEVGYVHEDGSLSLENHGPDTFSSFLGAPAVDHGDTVRAEILRGAL